MAEGAKIVAIVESRGKTWFPHWESTHLRVLVLGNVSRCHSSDEKHDGGVVWQLHGEVVRVVQRAFDRKTCHHRSSKRDNTT